jgi:hypothetical protein
MSSEPTFHDSQHLLDLWRGRLLEARKTFELAVTETKTADMDFTAGTLPTPDGGVNLVGRLRAETRARDEYMRVLQIFTDLVVSGSGKKPEE